MSFLAGGRRKVRSLGWRIVWDFELLSRCDWCSRMFFHSLNLPIFLFCRSSYRYKERDNFRRTDEKNEIRNYKNRRGEGPFSTLVRSFKMLQRNDYEYRHRRQTDSRIKVYSYTRVITWSLMFQRVNGSPSFIKVMKIAMCT